MIQDNVVPFNTGGYGKPDTDDKNVWECIDVFLKRVEQDSPNTRSTYERAIRDFFNSMKNKDIEHLSEGDLVFSRRQIDAYQTMLRDKFKMSTVNTKISAVKKLYTKLEEYDFDVNANWFNVDRYDGHDKEPYDPMTHDEIVKAISLVSSTRVGEQKAMLLRLAYATAFRRQSLLDLKWTDLIERDGVWFIKTLGKGNKWDHKKISDGLYTELMGLKANAKGRDKIFTLTNKTVNRMMNFIRESIDFADRRITFHSLKKSSIEEVALITNYDIKAMQRHGNHASSTTTLNDYMKGKALDDLITVDIDYHVPVEAFDDLTKEELLDIIRKSDRNTQIKLLQTLNS